jgi:hypothetical protein
MEAWLCEPASGIEPLSDSWRADPQQDATGVGLTEICRMDAAFEHAEDSDGICGHDLICTDCDPFVAMIVDGLCDTPKDRMGAAD